MTQLPVNTIICGDCLKVMKGWPDGCIQTCVTSPPYWGLRDYGVEGQLGLEKTPEEYVAKMVEVFRGIWRVLRDDGILWLNLGDSYAGGGNGGGSGKQRTNKGSLIGPQKIPPNLKPKDLCGIPWRVALALQADGWYLRQDIIWHKPNPMPESVTDRCTKAHEYIFLLTKKPRYFYDAEAIREPHAEPWRGKGEHESNNAHNSGRLDSHGPLRQAAYVVPVRQYNPAGRNKRSVWTVPTQPCKEAHFATFPPKLIEPCILAGTSQKGCCPECGAPWERIVEKTKTFESGSGKSGNPIQGKQDLSASESNSTPDIRMGPTISSKTTGWRSTCECRKADFNNHWASFNPIPCVVFDPFMGAGTTAMVAIQNGRNYAGIELSPEYTAIAETRIAAAYTGVTIKEARNGQGALFS